MTTLVVGASGATGRLLVEQLLKQGQKIKIIVRSPDGLPDCFKDNNDISIIHASVLNLSDAEMTNHVKGCDAVASCLGHNLTVKGIYGKPHRLVTDTVRRLCNAIRQSKPEKSVKFVLMNTTGNSNRDLSEPTPLSQKCAIWLIRHLLPPHADNENAADYLRTQIGQSNEVIEWAVVRPDTLIDENEVTEYEVFPSPIRNAIFDAGKSSRINVSHFMADLINNHDTWFKWKGRMPVIYNKYEEG